MFKDGVVEVRLIVTSCPSLTLNVFCNLNQSLTYPRPRTHSYRHVSTDEYFRPARRAASKHSPSFRQKRNGTQLARFRRPPTRGTRVRLSFVASTTISSVTNLCLFIAKCIN
ncbi:hypothetical protein M378DRAFT_735567 [Amanita muscaria Koide BX008]|uniref:Uncharacterized protein n=1 Tax=Amanita muscaria (strain Koide BX008) TaxID=946122 RepID=A0A0C2WMZ0_AMAMK|nr:hypothetical protein M378DRAFT_735567 [Amanita muscaria Koide BX008]